MGVSNSSMIFNYGANRDYKNIDDKAMITNFLYLKVISMDNDKCKLKEKNIRRSEII